MGKKEGLIKRKMEKKASKQPEAGEKMPTSQNLHHHPSTS